MAPIKPPAGSSFPDVHGQAALHCMGAPRCTQRESDRFSKALRALTKSRPVDLRPRLRNSCSPGDCGDASPSKQTWERLGAPAPEALFDQLAFAYSEPHRKYHTVQHLLECFALFDQVRNEPGNTVSVELALWFHDAVYDTHAPDNETALEHELNKA